MASGIEKSLQGFYSLGGDNINKLQEDAENLEEGIVGDPEDELDLKIDDDELLKLAKQWTENFEKYAGDIDLTSRQTTLENYWLGGQAQKNKTKGVIKDGFKDNIVFESIETLLPQITRQSPEPVVFISDDEEAVALSRNIKGMLQYISDLRSLKLRIKDAARHWMLYYLGVVKIGWDFIENEITISVIRPQKLILDPTGKIEAGRFTGQYIGELRRATADVLIKRFPKKKDFIKKQVKGKMGTEMQYTEWWTSEYVFYTYEKTILAKSRNPHWEYEDSEEQIDQYGKKIVVENVKKNHFLTPQMPYTFLSVFSLGKQPHDETSQTEQIIQLQDMLNKRVNQIDKNVDEMNGALVFGSALDSDKASRAVAAMQQGKAIRLDVENPRNAFVRDQAPPLPRDVFLTVEDTRNQIRNIIGVRGSSAQGTQSERTVRGKIMARTNDVDRSSLQVEYIEQMVDYIFNWFVQMMFVYYDEQHAGSILGNDMGRQFLSLSRDDLRDQKVSVSVVEGSMIPKDSLTQRNEAIDLWSAGALDPITLFERLEFADPKKMAKNLFLWQQNPQALFEDEQQPQQMMQPQPQAPQIAQSVPTPSAMPTLGGLPSPLI